MSVWSKKNSVSWEALRYRAAVGFAGLLLTCACTTTTTQSFRVAESSNVDAAFIATDADFSKYHQLLAEDMGIFFPKNVHMSDEDLARIRQIFRGAFLPKLDRYTIVNTPAPGTLAVQATLIDLRKAGVVDLPNVRSELRDVAQPGSLMFLMELRDSQTDRVLGRAADSTAAPAFAYGDGSATDWNAVEAAAERWSSLFRDFLDNNLGK
jgi:hypothetical protein